MKDKELEQRMKDKAITKDAAAISEATGAEKNKERKEETQDIVTRKETSS